MNLFKSGAISGDVTVARPAWPRFMANSGHIPSEPREEAAAALMSPVPAPTAAPAVVPEYEDVLRQARLQAAEILQEAANEAESAVTFARQDGFEHGRLEGMAAAQAEVDFLRREQQTELEKARIQADSIRKTAEAAAQAAAAQADSQAQALLAQARDEAAAILEAVRQEQNRRLDAAQGALIELAVAATQRLVQGHLALQPEAVVAMMAAGLRRLKDCNCSVRVSPQDLPLLEAQRSTLERELATGFLQLQPDPGLSPGNYIINSPQGQIDGRLEKQTGVLRSALTNALGGSAT